MRSVSRRCSRMGLRRIAVLLGLFFLLLYDGLFGRNGGKITAHGVKVWLLLWRETFADLGSFDLLANHLAAQVSFSTNKASMKVRSLVPAVTKSRKAVKIELSLKTGILGLIEKLWHDLCHKLFWFVHDEGSSMRLPADDGLISLGFHVIEHNMELPRKSVVKRAYQQRSSQTQASYILQSRGDDLRHYDSFSSRVIVSAKRCQGM